MILRSVFILGLASTTFSTCALGQQASGAANHLVHLSGRIRSTDYAPFGDQIVKFCELDNGNTCRNILASTDSGGVFSANVEKGSLYLMSLDKGGMSFEFEIAQVSDVSFGDLLVDRVSAQDAATYVVGPIRIKDLPLQGGADSIAAIYLGCNSPSKKCKDSPAHVILGSGKEMEVSPQKKSGGDEPSIDWGGSQGGRMAGREGELLHFLSPGLRFGGLSTRQERLCLERRWTRHLRLEVPVRRRAGWLVPRFPTRPTASPL